jgi:hypothetical protein
MKGVSTAYEILRYESLPLGLVWIKRDGSGLNCILGIEREISSYYTSIHLIPPQYTLIQYYPNKPLVGGRGVVGCFVCVF